MSDSAPQDIGSRGDSKRRTIQIFREAAAPTLNDSGMMENNSSESANAGLAKLIETGLEEGHILKCLFKSPDPDGFSLTYAWFKGNYPLVPHKHNTDCLYYVIAGDLLLGKNVLRAGDGFFLPADAGYSYTAGPDGVELLEFRNSTRFDITVGDGSSDGWERLAHICTSNRDLWKSQRPPSRVTQG